MEYSLDSVTALEFLQYCSLFFRQWNFIFLIILPCMKRILFLDPESISEVKFAAGGILVPFRGKHLVYSHHRRLIWTKFDWNLPTRSWNTSFNTRLTQSMWQKTVMLAILSESPAWIKSNTFRISSLVFKLSTLNIVCTRPFSFTLAKILSILCSEK
jgi:hypothetical protein